MKLIVKAFQNDSAWDRYVTQLSELGEVVRVASVAKSSADANILITTRLTREELELLPNLEAVFLYKTGTDGLPMDELKRKGITVVPSHAVGDVVAEHALTLGLCLLHRTVEFDNDLRNDIWFSDGRDYFWTSLCGSRAGIVGFGSIGGALYKKLSALGVQVKVLNHSGIYPNGVDGVESLDTLLEWCNILFLCLPLTPKTEKIIGEKELEKLKGKFLVNIARGGLVDQKALYEALGNHVIRGYASDVWYHSPSKTDRLKKTTAWDYDFRSLRNVVMSPHCATHVGGAHEMYIRDSIQNMRKWLEGQGTNIGA